MQRVRRAHHLPLQLPLGAQHLCQALWLCAHTNAPWAPRWPAERGRRTWRLVQALYQLQERRVCTAAGRDAQRGAAAAPAARTAQQVPRLSRRQQRPRRVAGAAQLRAGVNRPAAGSGARAACVPSCPAPGRADAARPSRRPPRQGRASAGPPGTRPVAASVRAAPGAPCSSPGPCAPSRRGWRAPMACSTARTAWRCSARMREGGGDSGQRQCPRAPLGRRHHHSAHEHSAAVVPQPSPLVDLSPPLLHVAGVRQQRGALGRHPHGLVPRARRQRPRGARAGRRAARVRARRRPGWPQRAICGVAGGGGGGLREGQDALN
jgi:hypothetical protein